MQGLLHLFVHNLDILELPDSVQKHISCQVVDLTKFESILIQILLSIVKVQSTNYKLTMHQKHLSLMFKMFLSNITFSTAVTNSQVEHRLFRSCTVLLNGSYITLCS